MLIVVVLASLVAIGRSQIETNQYTALVDVFNAIGCNLTRCLQFDVNDNCTGMVTCSKGNVTAIVVPSIPEKKDHVIPSSIGVLTALVSLTIAAAQLTSLPVQIGLLTALTELNLQVNSLTSLPTSIGNLTRLGRIIMTSNRLVALPTEMRLLTSMTSISLQDNRLAAFPSLPLSLVVINIQDNPTMTGAVDLSRFRSLTSFLASETQISALQVPPMIMNCQIQQTRIDCLTAPNMCACSARIKGDDCLDRIVIGDGTFSISAFGATSCTFCGECPMHADLWLSWTASCTGAATVDTCGFAASARTMMGIYRAACPDHAAAPTPATCNAGTCMPQTNARVTINVQQGEEIVIRVGVTTASSAPSFSGPLNVTCVAGPTTTQVTSATAIAAPSTTALLTRQANQTSATTTTTAATATSATRAAVPEPDKGPDVGLIAGLVGGIGGLLVVLGVAAALVLRSRRARAGSRAPSAYGNGPAALDLYHDTADVRAGNPNNETSAYQAASANNKNKPQF